MKLQTKYNLMFKFKNDTSSFAYCLDELLERKEIHINWLLTFER
jgi:predicted CopG family antitoxin